MLFKVLAAMPWGIIIGDGQDSDCPILYSNPAFIQMLPEGPDDILGHAMRDVLSRYRSEDDFQDHIRHVMEKGESRTIQVEQFDASPPFWYKIEISPVLNGEGRPEYILGVIEDVSERKMREAQLIQSQKLEALGQLAGGVAHDFNNLLSIIDGYARIARKEVGEDHSVASYLDRVIEAIKRGASLTKQLLTFGRHNIVTEAVTDLGQLVQDQEMLLKPLLDASVTLSIKGQSGLFIDCAPDSIGQILINLAVNARDAMEKVGGQLSIDVSMADEKAVSKARKEKGEKCDYVCLKVSDTGSGMDEETKKRIFDPFFTTKDQGKGTGLGLSMVYGLVKQMNGFVDVESTAGEGTSIMIYFPVSERQPVKKITHVEGEGGQSIRLEGYTVLVAEDEPDIRKLVGQMLEDMGMTVLKAGNGNEALAVQEDYEGQIDFLVTDVVMPELDGVRLARLFESVRPDANIVFMSGYPASGQMARIEIPDGAYLLPKPIKYDALAHVLHRMVSGEEDGQSDLQLMAGHWETN